LDVLTNSAEIILLVNRNAIEGSKKTVPCNLKLKFIELVDVRLIHKFPTDGSYNDVSFEEGLDLVGVYFNLQEKLSDDSKYNHENYSWMIRAKRMKWNEV
jgi:hypothetical protein